MIMGFRLFDVSDYLNIQMCQTRAYFNSLKLMLVKQSDWLTYPIPSIEGFPATMLKSYPI